MSVYPSLFGLYDIPAAFADCVVVGDVLGPDGLVRRSHEGVQDGGHHLGPAVASGSRSQDEVDGERLHVEGELLVSFISATQSATVQSERDAFLRKTKTTESG